MQLLSNHFSLNLDIKHLKKPKSLRSTQEVISFWWPELQLFQFFCCTWTISKNLHNGHIPSDREENVRFLGFGTFLLETKIYTSWHGWRSLTLCIHNLNGIHKKRGWTGSIVGIFFDFLDIHRKENLYESLKKLIA